MKKTVSLLLIISLLAGVFCALPLNASAAVKRVSLKASSATLKISKKNGKTVRGTYEIKLKKVKGAKLKSASYKSSNPRVAAVSSKGKITAKAKGSAKITVGVKFIFKKRTFKKNMTFKVTVRDTRKSEPVNPVEPTKPAETEPFSDEYAVPLNDPPQIDGTKTGSLKDKAFLDKLSGFSSKLYEMCSKESNDNYVMSPVSVYLALAMLYSVGDDGVKSDIESLAEMNSEDFEKTGKLFKSLVHEYKSFNGDTVSRLDLTNSVWIDDSKEADAETLKKLADDMYCQAFKTPFGANNKAANNAIRKYIKHQTNGLIDQDFDLYPDTLFALINTLYFKDVWDLEREGLNVKQKDFKTENGSKKIEFLEGEYINGKVQQTEKAKYFYATTSQGYKVKFILPKSGYTLDQATNAADLNTINRRSDFGAFDDNGTEHFTRCIFPSFKLEKETPLKKIFENNNLLKNAFTSYFSPLLKDEELCVSDIKHKVVLDVSKTGVEGAAVTIISSKANSSYPDHKIEYHDFVLDSAFGFIVTDPSDIVLFEGKVTDPA